MANVNWPSAPVTNQIYTFGTISWIWTGDAWRVLPNNNQVTLSWQQVGPWVYDTITEFDIGWEADNYTWGSVDYI